MDFAFGICHENLSKAEIARRDKICWDEGGHGFSIAEPVDGVIGWQYYAPNHGEPHNSRLISRVLTRVAQQ